MADETVETAGSGATKRALIIASAIVAVGLSIAFHSAWRGWLCESAWFHSVLIDGPALVLAIIAWLELGHSTEANEHRQRMSGELANMTKEASKAGEYLRQRNDLEQQNIGLRETLAVSTQQIAENTKRVPTRAERNASTLGKYMRKNASVATERLANLPSPYELVELKDGILTLFSPALQNGTSAIYRRVDCEDLTIDENPQGGCSIRINVTKYQGLPVDLGQVTKWEDRSGLAPAFDKAPGVACNASYGKGGSAEVKTLNIFQARDGTNSFQLESSDGSTAVGDSVQVSKRFMATQIEYFAANFTRSSFGTGATQGGFRLFVC